MPIPPTPPTPLPRRALAFLAPLFLAATAHAQFTFVHASDVHFGANRNHEINARLYAELAARTPTPAFAIVTGDICEYGTDDEYALYRAALPALGPVKLYPTPGNHDVRWNPRGKEGYTRGTGQPLYHSFTHVTPDATVHFANLDSTVLLGHWGHFSKAQLTWLKADLDAATKQYGPDLPIVLGFHHWIGRDSIQVDNEQELIDLVRPYNVVLWLNGHGHSDLMWNVEGVPAFMVKGLYQLSYNVIEVTKTEMIVRRRWVPDAKKPTSDKEILRDKSVPDELIPPSERDLLRLPLARKVRPEWSAEVRVGADAVTLTATPPPGAKLSYRVGTDKPTDFDGSASVPLASLTPGQHVLTVLATTDDKHTYTRTLPLIIPSPPSLPGLAPAWSTHIGGEVQSRLVRHADLVLVSSMGNDLVALDAKTGAERYRVKTEGSIFSAACVDGDTVYFGSADHHVYAADAATGAVKWKTKTEGAVLAGPAVAHGIVCVGSTDTKIYGLDAATGSVRWTVQGKNMYQSQTATDGTAFYVGGWDNHFRAIDAKTGALRWDLELGRKQRFPNFSAFAPAITSPAVGDGKVFVSTNDGILHALATDTGRELWQIDWKKMGYSSPLYHQGKVYAALSDEGKVFAADANTGKLLWTTPTGAVIYDSSFAYSDAGGAEGGGTVLIGNVNGTLNALDATTGQPRWQYRLAPGHLLASPATDAAFVYLGSMSGQVLSLPIAPTP